MNGDETVDVATPTCRGKSRSRRRSMSTSLLAVRCRMREHHQRGSDDSRERPPRLDAARATVAGVDVAGVDAADHCPPPTAAAAWSKMSVQPIVLALISINWMSAVAPLEIAASRICCALALTDLRPGHPLTAERRAQSGGDPEAELGAVVESEWPSPAGAGRRVRPAGTTICRLAG